MISSCSFLLTDSLLLWKKTLSLAIDSRLNLVLFNKIVFVLNAEDFACLIPFPKEETDFEILEILIDDLYADCATAILDHHVVMSLRIQHIEIVWI